MTKLFVVEARRLLPVAVLFLMLVAVSIYDGLANPTAPVVTEPNSVPYRTLLDSAQSEAMEAKVVTDLQMWTAMHTALGVRLTDYDFNPEQEIAVFLLNCQLRSTRESEDLVELIASARKNTFQLVLFNKGNLNSQEVKFVLKEQ